MEKPINIIAMDNEQFFVTPEMMESLLYHADVDKLLYIPAIDIADKNKAVFRPEDFKMMAINPNKIVTIERTTAVLVTEEDD